MRYAFLIELPARSALQFNPDSLGFSFSPPNGALTRTELVRLSSGCFFKAIAASNTSSDSAHAWHSQPSARSLARLLAVGLLPVRLALICLRRTNVAQSQ